MIPISEIQKLIGRPWSPEYNCYHLARDVVSLFNYQLPPVFDVDPDNELEKARAFKHHPERKRWIEVSRPKIWAAVLMRRPTHKEMVHCGVFLNINQGMVIHSDRYHDTVLDSMLELKLRPWHPLMLVPNV